MGVSELRFRLGIKACDSFLRFRFGICFWCSCVGFGYAVFDWDSGFGDRFGIDVTALAHRKALTLTRKTD